MWFKIEDNKLDYLNRAPYNITNEIVINAPPEKVFSVLVDKSWKNWFHDFKDMEWISPEPHKVGSKRIVNLKLLSVKETIIAWEAGKRFSFSITEITLPLVKDMVEDMQFERTAEGNTKMTWKVYYKPTIIMSAIHPIARMIFSNMFGKSINNFKKFVETKN